MMKNNNNNANNNNSTSADHQIRSKRTGQMRLRSIVTLLICLLPSSAEALSSTLPLPQHCSSAAGGAAATTATAAAGNRQTQQRIRSCSSTLLYAATVDEELDLEEGGTITEMETLEYGPDRSVDVIRILSNGTDRGHYHHQQHQQHQQQAHQQQQQQQQQQSKKLQKKEQKSQKTIVDEIIDNDSKNKDNMMLETTLVQEETKDKINFTTRSLWRRRHARSITEGIRREKSSPSAHQLSSLLKKAHQETMHANRRLIARTITGFISAVAEEADGLEVGVSAKKGTPLWEKEIDSIQINFSRLGFRPLRLGGLDDAIHKLEDSIVSTASKNNKRMTSPTATPSTSSTATKNTVTETEDGLEMTDVSCMNEAFTRIDADNSGTLDSDEIAMALDVVTASSSDGQMLSALASELVELYDTNGDGVVDFDEYQLMVEDMAALRQVQLERKSVQGEDGNEATKSESEKEKETTTKTGGRWFGFGRGAIEPPPEEIEQVTEKSELMDAAAAVQEATEESKTKLEKAPPIKGTGTITLTGLKLDLRRLVFGFLPLVKKITPGGPLVLEPFTATVHGSFSEEDVAQSLLLDDGLRRLVARALRRRVRSVRDIMDGALFYGRSWNMASIQAPVVEVPELTEITFDKQNRLLITGRVLIQTSPDAPVIENAFKVRTKLGTRLDGQVIRLEQPELALVLECPQAWERNIVSVCNKFNLTVPTKPDPLYSFFPIYSPFKVEDNDGFDLGPDNCIKSIYIKDGALRFEMQAILRPGRFLGSHYVAFTLPMRTFLITLDRVFSGIRTARKNKREAQRAKALESSQSYGDIVAESLSTEELMQQRDDLKFTEKGRNGVAVPMAATVPPKKPAFKPKPNKSFFSRFVEGYLGVAKNEVVKTERATAAISEWFGRQGDNSSDDDDAAK